LRTKYLTLAALVGISSVTAVALRYHVLFWSEATNNDQLVAYEVDSERIMVVSKDQGALIVNRAHKLVVRPSW